MASDLPVLEFQSAAAFAAWLQEHPDAAGAWLKIAKKGASRPTVSYAEALDVAICFGWIDGQKGALDDQFWRQRFTPRGPASRWSKINVEKAEALIAAGTMTPAGLREVERAKADGRWAAAYPGQARSEIPDDLRAALEADAEARAFFEVISSANRYAILYRISSVKKPEARARKIAEYVAMLARHETIHPQ
ncbi:MAG TPA: YdeI/OmpD-associated family protein [Streptosporangiaceae bacterium]|nr:YdeI/OmpD-associated family protein [Streptosporangiaceae bacterium]